MTSETLTPNDLTATNSRFVTGFFDTREDAESARAAMIKAGFGGNDIRLSGGHEADAEGKGFWATLKDFFLPEDDKHVFDEGMRRGGFVVTLSVHDDEYDEALAILNAHGRVDMDERTESWRAEGWGTPAGLALQGTDNMITSLPETSMPSVDATASKKEPRVSDAFRKPGRIDHVEDAGEPVVGGEGLIPVVPDERSPRMAKDTVETEEQARATEIVHGDGGDHHLGDVHGPSVAPEMHDIKPRAEDQREALPAETVDRATAAPLDDQREAFRRDQRLKDPLLHD